MAGYILAAVLPFWAGIVFHARIAPMIDAFFEKNDGFLGNKNENGEPEARRPHGKALP